jgi:hypothetical protein
MTAKIFKYSTDCPDVILTFRRRGNITAETAILQGCIKGVEQARRAVEELVESGELPDISTCDVWAFYVAQE